MLDIERKQKELETAIGRLQNGSKSMSDEDRDELLKLIHAIRDGLTQVVFHAKEANWFNRWLLSRAHARDIKFLLTIFEEILENPRKKPDLSALEWYANKLRRLGYWPAHQLLT